MRIRRAAAAVTISLIAIGSLAAEAQKPAPPPLVVPTLSEAGAKVLCVGCDEPFSTAIHEKLLKDLAANPYVAELRKALYQQDILHQFESKAHFDNCDFDSATGYIASLLDEVAGHVGAAQAAKNVADQERLTASARKAFFALGQALHAVQDFYAHTNYVELQAPKVKKVTDIDVLAPWRPRDVERIKELRAGGLFSGAVSWGFPKKCPAGTPSHGDIAKDSDTTKSGKIAVPNLQNMSRFKVAEFLAREASLKFMEDAFKRWPLLKEINGKHVVFELMVDRRGLDGER